MSTMLPPLLMGLFATGCSGTPPDSGGLATGFGDSAAPPWGQGDPALLCSVSLDCLGNVLDDPKGPCSIDIVSGDGVRVYQGPAGVELRGRSSLNFPKPQYSVELREHSELPIWPGFVWRYLDDGSDPGPHWMEPGFDDSAWLEGPAPLGYGEAGLATVVNAGSDPEHVHPTTYFRYTFSPAGLEQITEMELGVRRNDAVAVYLNGAEVLRENLGEDADYRTLAEWPISPEDEVLWLTTDLAAGLLVDVGNVVAAEVHQATTDSTDSRFDLYLEASGEVADVDLFGLGEESDWILNGLYVDRSLFRNKLAFDLFQSFGGAERFGAETLFCELTLDGGYQGIYSLGESIKRSEARLDLEAASTPGSSFIIKLDSVDGFHINAVGIGTWQVAYPEGDSEAEEAISEFLTGWEDAIRGPDPFNAETGQFSYVDMDSAVDWVLLQEFTKNVDAYQYSVYLWRDDGGTAFFAPWDFDLSMGYPYYDCTATGWLTRLEFVDAMAADPAFRTALAARWFALREGVMSEATIRERISAFDSTLTPGVARNFERWPIEDIAFATDELENWLCPVASYEEEHERVLEFISARLAWMDANIAEY